MLRSVVQAKNLNASLMSLFINLFKNVRENLNKSYVEILQNIHGSFSIFPDRALIKDKLSSEKDTRCLIVVAWCLSTAL